MAANNKQYVAINNYCESANLIVIRQNWIFSIVESVISGKYVFECSQRVTFIAANIFIICFANMHNGMKRIKNFCFNCEINYCYYSFFCGRTLSISINNFCCDKSEQKKFIKMLCWKLCWHLLQMNLQHDLVNQFGTFCDVLLFQVVKQFNSI